MATNLLSNRLLIAMPSLKDPTFEKSVIYVCEHHEHGTVGLIINRPMPFDIDLVFDQMHIEHAKYQSNKLPLLYGGPIQPERGFIIHRQEGGWRSSVWLQDDVIITTSNDIIRSIAENEGPKDVLFTLGFSAWLPHQIEREMQENFWLVCPYYPEILYEIPFRERWRYAGLKMGVDLHLLGDVGHA